MSIVTGDAGLSTGSAVPKRRKRMINVSTRLLLVSSVAVLCSWVWMTGIAGAAYTHSSVETIFSPGPDCTGFFEGSSADQIAVWEGNTPSQNLIYVSCQRSNGREVVKRFHPNGEPAPFSADKPYIEGNAITGTPESPEEAFTGQRFTNYFMPIAIDNSNARNGMLVVGGGCRGCQPEAEDQGVQLFAPSGEFLYEFPTKVRERGPQDVDVGPDGSIYVVNSQDVEIGDGRIRKYSSTSLTEVGRLYNNHVLAFVRVQPNGEVWTGFNAREQSGGDPLELVRWEQSQFGTNFTTHTGSVEGVAEAVFSPLVSPTGRLLNSATEGQSVQNPEAIDVDRATGDLYVANATTIVPYSSGDSEEIPHQNGPAFGSGVLTQYRTNGFDVTKDGRVYVTREDSGTVVIFAPGKVLPNIKTPEPQIDDIGHESATVSAQIERLSGAPIIDCEVEYGTSKSYGSTAPCSPDPGASPPSSYFSDPVKAVSAVPAGLTTGATYHYRFKATNEDGDNYGSDRTFSPVFVLKVKTEAADEIDTQGATLNGSFDPDNIGGTEYYFEYGGEKSYGQKTAKVPVSSAAGIKEVSASVSGLPAGKTIHYRIVAQNEKGVTKGADRTFRVASSPDVSGLRATDVAVDSATLNARIDPVGYETKYRFEYGQTTEYGSVVPASDKAIGAGNGGQPVSQVVKNLQPGVTYHFRVVATNEWGSTVSPDTTFDFAPPSCPNVHVRQQTGSAYLPDCRAYELVSPSNAGSVLLYPGKEMELMGDFFLFNNPERPSWLLWPLNTGLARSPSRFSYVGGLGAVEKTDPSNHFLDMYVATRTNAGWVTDIPGLQGDEVTAHYELECSDSMATCVDHKVRDQAGGPTHIGENAPYLFNEGDPAGRLPTNVNVIPGGQTFEGDQRMSPDFSHFAFSSRTAVFAPGGLSSSPGSAYDNDIAKASVSLISLTPSKANIPADVGGSQYFEFPGISADGSYILMQLPGVGGGVHLYMRNTSAELTYDISRGLGVNFVGMTRNGKKVFFTTTAQLETGDTDTSADMYMWEGPDDTLTRVSIGNSQDNADSCGATWTSKCDAIGVSTEKLHPWGRASIPGTDDAIATASGDVYFYSPSSLDPDRPGLTGQRNLYVYRSGTVQLVATLDPGTVVNRMQISPDGTHAAFVTASQLTGYANHGFKEVYTYDADTGNLQCASCRPDGVSPTSHVEASQSGRFMSDDGRTFFATKDSLVVQDTNGITDVYEYVAGRPQLITAGNGSRDFTGGGTASVLLPGVFTGLEAVSADGVDVYFSTYDTLVPQDENGAFVKFYDARTNGGFDLGYKLAPCEAADECHGATSSAPLPASIATQGDLGSSGNRQTVKNAKRKKKKRKPANGRGKRSKRHSKGGNHG
jgi:hypothetical protein